MLSKLKEELRWVYDFEQKALDLGEVPNRQIPLHTLSLDKETNCKNNLRPLIYSLNNYRVGFGGYILL